ncbi:hypothetical protein Agabi119p4_11726 [Agaricus bisporus var. burnettii]|uniref:Uncharacterized protein n=1 Tax=Agaricus bisporus var. burnettii TaxID=192524 RepID=A0A8H7EVC8_AGABI|nr:hypothetical protein Agabi119p4_11726 [Agaricus bisporus var. burnettii]
MPILSYLLFCSAAEINTVQLDEDTDAADTAQLDEDKGCLASNPGKRETVLFDIELKLKFFRKLCYSSFKLLLCSASF